MIGTIVPSSLNSRHPVPLLSGAVSRRIRQPSVLPDAGAFSSLITYLAFDERVGLGLDDRIPSPSGDPVLRDRVFKDQRVPSGPSTTAPQQPRPRYARSL